MKILLLDGYNLIYRARSGFAVGQWPVVFNFIRSLKPLVEKFNPDLVYFVLEGKPVKRINILPEYKANRVRELDKSFINQRGRIIEIVQSYLPITTIKHLQHECDDVIASLIKQRHKNDHCVVVSTDTDFIQLLNLKNHIVTLYNPVKKKVIEQPSYDYVAWKALRGDNSDNIRGIKGIGDKRATALMTSKSMLNEFLNKDSLNKKIFEKNYSLIQFENVDLNESYEVKSKYDADSLYKLFEDLEFSSMINETYWPKFNSVFSKLKRI